MNFCDAARRRVAVIRRMVAVARAALGLSAEGLAAEIVGWVARDQWVGSPDCSTVSS
ncbi:Uncharacterised protein [Mycobacteroides abscessus subsp. abscessus]|nr:Uncharacterised protein [Mycobacteroides abscessus subsp. abscessus]